MPSGCMASAGGAPTCRLSFDVLSHRLGWKNKASEGLHAFTYEKWRPNSGGPIEAEDLFDDAVLKRFLDEPGNSVYCTGTLLNKKQQRWHYDLDKDGKIAFTGWLEQNATPAVFEPWRPVLQDLTALAKSAGAK